MPVDVVIPSNLGYTERLALRSDNEAEYGRLYCNAYHASVWDRLLVDAEVRQRRTRSTITSNPNTYVDSAAASAHNGRLSGYQSNTDRAVYTPGQSFKTGHRDDLTDPVGTMHPMVEKKFRHKHPIDYLAAVRPDAETTNQTLRMLGTYESDHFHAARNKSSIPASCPGGRGFYHPDVRVTYTGQRSATALASRRPMSAYPAVGRTNLGSVSAATSTSAAAAPKAAHCRHAAAGPNSASSPEAGPCTSAAEPAYGAHLPGRPQSARPHVASAQAGGGDYASLQGHPALQTSGPSRPLPAAAMTRAGSRPASACAGHAMYAMYTASPSNGSIKRVAWVQQ